MGIASGLAQKLPGPITSLNKLQYAEPAQNLYIICSDTTVDGILKVGRKKLFVTGDFGQMHEITPLCVLDFYVHEKKQRSGVGSRLFNYMLEAEKVTPDKLAYDRPSEKFLAFLHKYFGLRSYTPQSNNYVVFRDYFLNNSKSSHNDHQRAATVKERPLTGSTTRQHRPGKKYDQPRSSVAFGAPSSGASAPVSSVTPSSATLPSPRSLAPLSTPVSLPPSEPGVVAPSRPAPLPSKAPSAASSASTTPRRSKPPPPNASPPRNPSLPPAVARQPSDKWSDASDAPGTRDVASRQSTSTVSSKPSLFGRVAHSPHPKGRANPLIGLSNSYLY
eukprot:TRINITY_DN3544_c0_g1_i1.p1 TRINITY_DN3544_c0_g1~~TRINITY_DN3544_c0_g1_i1.p1  ORF type:complete len:365 (+),score=45.21 TRINITY_DN3544_c0_g1_i1:102-1097(+)